MIASGSVGPGDAVRILPSGRTSTVERIVTMDGDLDEAVAGPVGDAGPGRRGRLLARRRDRRGRRPARGRRPVRSDDRVDGRGRAAPGPRLLAEARRRRRSPRRSTHPKYQINVNSLEHLAAQTLELNAIGVAEIATDREIVFEPYAVDGASTQSRARRVHPDRQVDQRDGRLRDAPFRASPGAQYPLPGARRQPRNPCRA